MCININVSQGQIKYLVHAGVVQEGEQRLAVSGGGGLVVHHSDLDPFWVPPDTQTDQRDLDDGQQELETQRAANTRERVRNAAPTCRSSQPLLLSTRYNY